jgi:putative oxidoreductase
MERGPKRERRGQRHSSAAQRTFPWDADGHCASCATGSGTPRGEPPGVRGSLRSPCGDAAAEPETHLTIWKDYMAGTWDEWAPVPLRLILGFGFTIHGWDKISDGTEGLQGMLQMIGIPGGAATAWMVALLEFFGGLALIAGALIPIVASLLIVDMLVAMATVHLPHGFSFMNLTGIGTEGPTFGMPGYEINLLYIAGLGALILGGAGAYAIDRSSRERKAEAFRPRERAPGLVRR